MRKKLIPSAIAFILAIMLSGYIYLSACAGRALKISEFTKFSSTIIWAAIFHINENGGSRALSISKEALSSAPSKGAIEIAGRDYVFPLPRYTVRRDEGDGMQHYLVVASFDELQDYFKRELPESGWKRIDQMGAGYFFEGYSAQMVITQHFYLTTGISEINISIREE